jgi:hypothetical protein
MVFSMRVFLRSACLAAAAAWFVGCAHQQQDDAALRAIASPRPERVSHKSAPPPLDAFLAPYADGRMCAVAQDHEIVRGDGSADEKMTVRFCPPAFPELLIAQGYEADCIVTFRIGATGNGENASATCTLHGVYDPGSDWARFSEAAFVRLAEMSVAQSQYAPPPDGASDKRFARPINFRLQ